MVQNGSPLNAVHRGVAMTTTKLDLGRQHTEANSIMSMFGANEMYLGVLKLWQQYRIINVPILNMTELGKNVIYTNGFNATMSYTIPGKVAAPYVIEDINDSSVEKIGVANNEFYLVLNTNRYVKGDILTYDPYGDFQAMITKEVEPYGSGWLLTLKLTTEDSRAFLSRKWVRPGVEWTKIGNGGNSEWSVNTSGITQDSDMMTTFQFKTAQSEQALEHIVTAHADMLKYDVEANSGTGVADIRKGISSQYADPQKAAVLYWLQTNGEAFDPLNRDQQKTPIPGSGAWMPLIMQYMLKEQAKMEEMTYMFSRGGLVWDERGTAVKLGMGYYPQIKEMGNYRTYSDPRQVGQVLKDVIGDMFYGRTDIPPHTRRTKFRCGRGAALAVYQYFLQRYKGTMPFPVWADHPALKGILTGDNNNLHYDGFRFTSFRDPEAGIIEIEEDPSLNWEGNKSQTSYIGNLSRRSYTILVEDVTDSNFSNAVDGAQYDVKEGFNNGPNVVLIKPEAYRQTKISYTVGHHCPDFLRAFVGAGPNAHFTGGDFEGFKMRRKWAGEVWVKDPSRVFLIEIDDPTRFN